MDDANRIQRYVLIGDGGFSKEVADLVSAIGGMVVAKVVEDVYLQTPSVTGATSIADLPDIDCDGVVLALGDTEARHRIHDELAGRYEVAGLVSLSSGRAVRPDDVRRIGSHIAGVS